MKKVIFAIIVMTFLVYLFVLFILLFAGNRGVHSDLTMLAYAMRSMNLIPFQTIGQYVSALFSGQMNWTVPVKNLLGNLLLFFPMGIYLPFLIRKINNWRSFLISIVVLLFVVELLQFLFMRGTFDIDDLLLNLSGAMIGFLLWKSRWMQSIIRKLAGSTKGEH